MNLSITKEYAQEIEEDNANILQMIETALQKKSGRTCHFLDKSFTGDIVKYDKERQQLIIKISRKACLPLFVFQILSGFVWFLILSEKHKKEIPTSNEIGIFYSNKP